MKPSAHIVVIGFDGLRPDMVDAATAPCLAGLMQSAAVLERHRSVFPTETRTALASLMTGTSPAVHGIVSNTMMARALDQSVRIDTARLDDLHRLGRQTQGFTMPATLSDHLARAGLDYVALSTGREGTWRMLWWGAERHGHLAMNPRYPGLGTPRDQSADLARQVNELVEAENTDGSALPDALMDVFLTRIWPARKPAVSVLWFVEADSAGHYSGLGSSAQRAAIRRLDDQLAKLLDWRSHRPERGRIHIAVASDHGQIKAGAGVDLVTELRQAGFRAGPTLDGETDVALVPGRSPGLWLKDPSQPRLAEIVATLAEAPWCGPLFSAGSSETGPFGHVPGTFAHGLVQADHPLAPHLRVTFCAKTREPHAKDAEGLPADLDGSGLDPGAGHHGGLHPKELDCLLVIDGEQVRPGRHDRAPSGLVDIVPTVLALLDLPVPAGLTGRVLSEILAAGSADPMAASHEQHDLTIGTRRHRLSRQRMGRHVYLDGARSDLPASVSATH